MGCLPCPKPQKDSTAEPKIPGFQYFQCCACFLLIKDVLVLFFLPLVSVRGWLVSSCALPSVLYGFLQFMVWFLYWWREFYRSPWLGGTSCSFAWELKDRLMTIVSVFKGLNWMGMEKTTRSISKMYQGKYIIHFTNHYNYWSREPVS